MTTKEFKRYKKYFVFKQSDIHLYLSNIDKENLNIMSKKIGKGRTLLLKESSPNYIVVNEKEPYSEKVWELIKKHWEIEQDKIEQV